MENLRKEYKLAAISEALMHADPVQQFKLWFDECFNITNAEANAMILSTVSSDLKPSSRVVLLKNIMDGNFVFFTNYNSRKGKELSQNPNASLLFYWDFMERQVRIEGVVSKISENISDEYFYSRPLLSQAGAIISSQSEQITSRDALDEKLAYYESHPEELRRPTHWGGFALKPDYFEFWQGRTNRLHDRIMYSKTPDGDWLKARLAP